MKQSLLILGLFLTCIGQALSQNYYYYSSTGTSAPFNWNKNSGAATATTVMAAPSNDVLSAIQTIPFSWSFYGQTVTSYRASDNGYITFDGSATKSYPNSHALPDTTSTTPKSAIFALWTDLNLQSVASGSTQIPPSIISWTYGTAPNRVHVIEWAYVTKQGVAFSFTSNYLLFSIRLYEAGGFDIVHTVDVAGINNAVIGAQNSTGTIGDMVNGSPFLGAPNPTGTGANATDIVYNFKYGVQPPIDYSVINPSISTSNTMFRRTVPTFISGDNTVAVGGIISNNGALPITSVTVNYTVDGVTENAKKISGISIPNNGGNYSYSVPYTATGAGKYHTIKVWLTGVNDSFTANVGDTISEQIFVINGGTNSLTMKPLVEYMGGAWCPWCPNGHVEVEQEKANDPNVVAVCWHYADKMSIPTDYTITGAFASPGYPSIMVDRKLYSGQATVAFGNAGVNDNPNLDAAVAQEGSNNPSIPVTLDILTKSWEPATRTISFTVTGKFADYAGGDVRLNALITEDSVRGPDLVAPDPPTGTNAGWNQNNNYSSVYGANFPSSDFYSEKSSIVGYVQNEVVEASLNGDWGSSIDGFTGDNVVIPPNTTFSKTFTFKLPTQVNVDYSKTVKAPDATDYHSTLPGYGYYKPESINLVAFVSNYNANDPTYSEVLNATEQPLFGWSAGVATYNSNVDRISMYPNPAANSATVEYTLAKTTDLTIEVYNVMGQKMQTALSGSQAAGTHTLSIDATHLSNGLYFVSFTSNGVKTTKQLMIQK